MCLAASVLMTFSTHADVLRVMTTPQGLADGSAWAHACTLKYALENAGDGDELWVAQGVYTPKDPNNPTAFQYCASCPSTNERHRTFLLPAGLKMYGGFRGPDDSDPNNPYPGESDLTERKEDIYITVLSGDLNGDDNTPDPNRDDNSYHVVTAHNVTETTKLSGVTVYGGNANDLDLDDIYERSGGGVLVVGTGLQISSLHITRCVFFDNIADNTGAGVAVIWPGIPEELEDIIPARIVSSTFTANIADPFDPNTPTGNGGGLSLSRAAFEVTNCVFDENTAALTGGGAYASGAGSNAPRGELTNNTFFQNKH